MKELHSTCQKKLENSPLATGLENVSFHSNPKERQINLEKSVCRLGSNS